MDTFSRPPDHQSPVTSKQNLDWRYAFTIRCAFLGGLALVVWIPLSVVATFSYQMTTSFHRVPTDPSDGEMLLMLGSPALVFLFAAIGRLLVKLRLLLLMAGLINLFVFVLYIYRAIAFHDPIGLFDIPVTLFLVNWYFLLLDANSLEKAKKSAKR